MDQNLSGRNKEQQKVDCAEKFWDLYGPLLFFFFLNYEERKTEQTQSCRRARDRFLSYPNREWVGCETDETRSSLFAYFVYTRTLLPLSFYISQTYSILIQGATSDVYQKSPRV